MTQPPSLHTVFGNMSRRLRFMLPAAFLASALGASAADTLLQASPFLPAPGTAGVAATVKDVLEFAGMSTLEQQTIVSIYNTQEKRGRWIAVGSSAEGIEVISYDEARDQVVVRHAGQVKVLKLREPAKGMSSGFAAAGTSGLFTPAAPPLTIYPTPKPTEPRKPVTVGQHEEARMFVADMLDIGMQTRNAYEEAQKKAAAEKAAGAARDKMMVPQPAIPLPAPAATPPSGG